MNAEDTVQSVLDYHRKTNHSVESVRAGNISLDFSILPRLYKLYRRAEALPLPEESAPSDVPALEAIAGDAPTRDGAPTLEDVAALLKLSAGITKWLKVPNGSMAFRAASCTGALYHIELYLVCGDLPGLPAGVYQYGAQDNALRRVRSGDYRGALVAATAGTRGGVGARVRCLHECILAERVEVPEPRVPARLLGLRHRPCEYAVGRVVAGPADARGHGFLGRRREPRPRRGRRPRGCRRNRARGQRPRFGDTRPCPRAGEPRDAPYSPKEIDYPLIRATHAATSLDEAGAAAWRALGGARKRRRVRR